MEAFFIYIIESSICLILFYLFFKVLLSRETFFRFNRFVLLIGAVVCCILPLIEFRAAKESVIQKPVREIENFIIKDMEEPGLPSESMETMLMENNVVPVTNTSGDIEPGGFDFSQILILCCIYGLGLLVTLTGLSISVFRMVQLIRKGKKIYEGQFILVLINRKICSFSFGKYIVLSEDDYLQNPGEILIHEQIHGRKRHSMDLLFLELLILFHWFNPVVWLLKREIQDIHEYEADNGVINQGIDAIQYQLLLVKKAVGVRSYAIANSFNHSKIKNRITMMLKRKSTQWARLKLLLFAPLAVVALQAFARPEIIQIQQLLNNNEGTTILPEESKRNEDSFPEKKEDVVTTKKTEKAIKTEPDSSEEMMVEVSEGVPMTDQEKAATKEFQTAVQQFSSFMEKQSLQIGKIFNLNEKQLRKEFEAASEKFEKTMQSLGNNFEQTELKKVESQENEVELAAKKFEDVMLQHQDEIKKGVESPEVVAAKENFKMAQEKFRESMNQLRANMEYIQDSEGFKSARKEFEKASEKFEEGMNQLNIEMKDMEDDPQVKAARKEFEKASEKFGQEMQNYQKRVAEKE